MPVTPEEWLPVLAKRLDAAYPRIARLRRYATGDSDLPEMGKNLKASWQAFQKKARTDFGGLAVGALANRIRLNGIAIGGNQNHPALAVARRIARDNRLTSQFKKAVKDYLTTSYGYLVVSSDEGRAVITREKPEMFYAATDPIRTWKAVATLKVWRDEYAGKDFARVVVPGRAVLFSRASRNTNGLAVVGAYSDDWSVVSEQEYDGDVPCIVLRRDDEMGLFEPHMDVIDRINLGKLQRLVTTALQAYRQRALKSSADSQGLPDKDADGNDIDFRAMFEPSPGAMWELPEGLDIWESQYTDTTPMLNAEKADARDFAAVSRTPVYVFTPESANQSAEGAAAAKEQHVALAEDEIENIKPGLDVLMIYALRVEGVILHEDETLDMLFVPADRVSLSEKYAAAGQAKAAGESWDSIARNILGYSPEQIRQDALARATEQLAITALMGAPNGGPNPGAAA
ncbi:phage portal protein [Paenarthrobacter nitroguajacolicus]|uniref:phage portal protein n=1 Tax=Paenarthrobacter nitroguajacolicus TaxID=211146 RepID=UPI00248C186D|nr:phage portal protein [Paenarthrobacter nitroguajacolicus]MDI2032988.1 hypothetical protein [Paenarthrobacter nitroguajacolicus]